MIFKELRGNPFEAQSDDNAIRINRDEYILIYKLDLDLNKNIYEVLSQFKAIKELDLQLYISKETQLLIIKTQSNSKKTFEEEYINISNTINNLNINAAEVSVEEYSIFLNDKINNQEKTLDSFNKQTDNAKYKKGHIEINDRFFTLMKIREYPKYLNLNEIVNIADISIKLKFKAEEKEAEIYSLLKDNLYTQKQTADKRVELTANNPIYPFRLIERIDKLNAAEGYNVIGLEINFLLEAGSENDLIEKTHNLKEALLNKLNLETLINNIKKDTFIEFLPVCFEKDLSIAFFYNGPEEFNISFFENIKLNTNNTNYLNKLMELMDSKLGNIVNLSRLILGQKNSMPVNELYDNGILELDDYSYSCIYEFNSVNYLLESEEKKVSILKSYQNYVNMITENIDVQLYIINSRIDTEKIENDLLNRKENKNQIYIEEYNQYLKDKINESYKNSSDTRYFIIINLKAKSIEDAEEENQRLYDEIKKEFNSFSCEIKRLPADQVNTLIYSSIFHPSKHNHYLSNDYDSQLPISKQIQSTVKKTTTNYIQTTNGFKKILYVKKYPNDMTDTFISNLTKLPFELEISIHTTSLNPEKGFKKINNKIISMESNRRDRAKKDQGTGYVPYKLENELVEGYYILDKISNDDQKLFLTSFYISIYAETLKALETRENILKTSFAKGNYEYNELYLRQKEGLVSILPIGRNETDQNRAILTENITFLHPFSYSKLRHGKGGFLYGLTEDNSLLVVDRKKYDNTSAFVLGTPGSGKSLLSKLEIINTFYNTDDDIIIIDPEREFGDLTRSIGGEVIKISTNTDNFINIMKLPKKTDLSFDEEVKNKIDFLITFLQKLTGENLSSSERSILDRCLRQIYKEYRYTDDEPVLTDLQNMLKKQPEEISKELMLKLEIYIEGSLDIFAKKSNVDINNRVVCFDIKDLRKQLKPSSLTAVLDSIWERLNYNREHNIFTWLYIDEFYILGRDKTSLEWLFEAWKRVRKYLGIPTGLTQNVGDLLENQQLSSMLSNSDINIVMKQKAEDRKKIASLLELSELQMDKITESQAGTGLLIADNTKLPFDNIFDPKKIPNLYKLITTSHKD